MDTRQARGEHLAQLHGARIKPVDGDLWFVPSSDGIGGYLVSTAPAAGSARCSCPDAQRGTKCKHAWAVEFAQQAQGALPAAGGAAVAPAPQTAPAWPQPLRRGQRGDLTAEEQVHVKAALRFLRIQHGGWAALAKALRYKVKTLSDGRPASARVVLRLARVAGAPVDDILNGRWPSPDACPYCGRRTREV